MTIEELAQKIQDGEQASLRKAKLDCEANLKNTITSIKQGRKWTAINVGYSGKYMINPQGEIYGIKAYGVPHLGHYYGTLDNPSPACFKGLWG